MRLTNLGSDVRAAKSIQMLAGRYDPAVFDAPGGRTRVRLAVSDDDAWDVVVADGEAAMAPADGRPDAVLTADA
jgi:hypothetical protein